MARPDTYSRTIGAASPASSNRQTDPSRPAVSTHLTASREEIRLTAEAFLCTSFDSKASSNLMTVKTIHDPLHLRWVWVDGSSLGSVYKCNCRQRVAGSAALGHPSCLAPP